MLEGMPAGLPVDLDAVTAQLRRRQGGYGRGRRMAIESDRAAGALAASAAAHHRRARSRFSSRTRTGRTGRRRCTSSRRCRRRPPGANRAAVTRPRPGHADLAGALKYELDDIRDVLERASARETAARVAVGALARQLLAQFGIDVLSHVTMIGGVGVTESLAISVDRIRAIPADSPLRCADAGVEAADDRGNRSGQGGRRHARRRFRGRRRGLAGRVSAATCSGTASSTGAWRRRSCRSPRSRPSASAKARRSRDCRDHGSTTRSCRARGRAARGTRRSAWRA